MHDNQSLLPLAQAAREAASAAASLSTDRKNGVLRQIAGGLSLRREWLMEENSMDLAEARRQGMPAALCARQSGHRTGVGGLYAP